MDQLFDLAPGTVILGVVPGFARNGNQMFDIQCSDGQKYRTFEPGKAQQAQAQINNPNVAIRIALKGQYKNFEGVYPAGQAPPIPGGNNGFAQPQQGAQFQPQGQFTPAPAGTFEDANKVEMRRVGGVQNASKLLGGLVSTGYYLNDDGVLDIDKLVADVVPLAGALTRYTVFGPSGQPEAAAAEPVVPALPPGVTAEQVAAWAAANSGATVTVGAPTAEAAPEEAAAAY